jgi:prepilin-type N-terminal cleavage/methylation domain-containing protein
VVNVKAKSKGFTLIELLVVIAVVGIMLGIGIMTAAGLRNPLGESATQLSSVLRQVRTRAISATSAYRLKATSSTKAIVEYALGCTSTTWITDSRLSIELESGLQFSDPNFIVCYQPRGTVPTALTVVLSNANGQTRSVAVYTAGAVVIQ